MALSAARRISTAKDRQKSADRAAIDGSYDGLMHTPQNTDDVVQQLQRAQPLSGTPSTSTPGICPASTRSAPAQKLVPDPANTATRVALWSLISSNASRRVTITSNAMAFIRSGRLSVTRVMYGRGLSVYDERHHWSPILDKRPDHSPMSLCSTTDESFCAQRSVPIQAVNRDREAPALEGIGTPGEIRSATAGFPSRATRQCFAVPTKSM